MTIIFRVYLVFCVYLSNASGKSTNTSIVSKITDYLTPYIQSLRLGLHTKNINQTPESIIDEKLKELTPYLQDNDDKKQKQEEKDETTIIDIMPRASFQNNTKHKNVKAGAYRRNDLETFMTKQNKIKMMLEKESVSNKTRQFVRNMLNDLTATMLQRQCPQINFIDGDLRRILNRYGSVEAILSIVHFGNDKNCYVGEIKMDDSLCNAVKEPYKHCVFQNKLISETECKRIIDMANANRTCISNRIKVNVKDCDDLYAILKDKVYKRVQALVNKQLPIIPRSNYKNQFGIYDMLNVFATKFLREYDTGKYAVRCNLMETDIDKKDYLRQADMCQNFRVCSEELKQFLLFFYKSLNDTVVHTLTNFAAMYQRDQIGDDSIEEISVVTAINRASNNVERKLASVFMDTVAKFNLDPNKDEKSNIASLQQFVKKTVEQLNKTIIEYVEGDLCSLRSKLVVSIKNDILHNLAIDLNNFEVDFVKQVCSYFATCKGDLRLFREEFRRKQGVQNKISNSIFAEVEFTLDDDLKQIIMNKNNKTLRQESEAQRRHTYYENLLKNNVTATRTSTKSYNRTETTAYETLVIHY